MVSGRARGVPSPSMAPPPRSERDKRQHQVKRQLHQIMDPKPTQIFDPRLVPGAPRSSRKLRRKSAAIVTQKASGQQRVAERKDATRARYNRTMGALLKSYVAKVAKLFVDMKAELVWCGWSYEHARRFCASIDATFFTGSVSTAKVWPMARGMWRTIHRV
jgi:hypothetical protein